MQVNNFYNTEMSYIDLVLIVLLAGSVAAQVNLYADCCETYCYREDENPYLYLGTKTAYEFVYGKSSNQHIVPYCRPVQFWSFNRHGTRYPKIETIKAFENLQKLKENVYRNYETRGSYPETGGLCDKDLEALSRWQWNRSTTESVANDLTQQGKDDMRFLARRYQTRYPELLKMPYSNQHFEFRYTESQRTRSSYEAFAEGLFGTDVYKAQAQPMQNNEITGNYKSCEAWTQNVRDNPDTFVELNKFKESDAYKRVIAHVSRRLGFKFTLNQTLVENMYDMCRYEKAWYVNRVSAWCTAFTKEQLKIMEYAEDLKYYYTTGYGTEMNYKLGCPAVKDMMERFERIINGAKNETKAVFQFTHTAELQLLLVSLGMYKDNNHLTANNIESRRQWRTSMLTPFSANLVAVLYRCNEGEKDRVMFFLNEKPVDYPGCHVGLCNWKYLKQKLQDTVNRCDVDFCQHGSAANNYLAYPLFVLTVLISMWCQM